MRFERGAARPRLPISLALLLTLAFVPSVVRAAPIWSWSFEPTEYVVGPSDSIIVGAVLFNHPLSPNAITFVSGAASFTGDLQKTYDFTFGPTGNSSEWPRQFTGFSVAPGESLPFVVGILTPIGGAVTPRIYPFCCEAHFAFGSSSADVVSRAPLNTFEITVTPEPMTLLLFGTTAAGLGLARWRRRLQR